MIVPKHHADLIESLDKYLRKTPRPSEYHPLLTDFGRYHPELYRDSIAEAIGAEINGVLAPNQARTREAVIRIYNRKTKEMAALYPFLFSVEGALRSQLATALCGLFQDDRWWVGYCQAIARGDDPTIVQEINTVSVPGAAFSRAVAKIIDTIDSGSGMRAIDRAGGFEFLTGATFGQLRYVVANCWTHLRQLFIGKRGGPAQIVKTDFLDLTKVILDVRNDLYHHRPVSNQQTFFDACERILDHFDHHVGAFDQALSRSVYVRPVFRIARQSRHDIVTDE